MYKTDDGRWEHDFRVTGIARYRISYGKVTKADATRLHAVAVALFRARDLAVIEALRAGLVNIEQLAQLREQGKPFSASLASVATEAPWPTIEEACRQYVQGLEESTKKADNTAKVSRSELNQALKFFDPAVRLDAITSAQVVAYQRWLRENKKSVNTITSYTARIGAMYRWHIRRESIAAREGKRAPRVLHVPLDMEVLSSDKERRTRYLTGAEAAKLLEVTPRPLLFVVAAGLYGGFRIDEVLHLRADFDVDWKIGKMAVCEQPEWAPKSKRSVRHVPIADELRPILLEQLERRGDSPWVTPSLFSAKQPFSKHTFIAHFGRIVADAELIAGRKDPQGVTFHTLRHTFASHLLMAGADMYTVAKLLGNTVQQVEDTYGHLSHDHTTAAVNRLAAVYRPSNLGVSSDA